jgi:hypothetical protein
LIDKKQILPLKAIRYSIISNEAKECLQSPLGLQKLALFLMDAQKESMQRKDHKFEEKPMVLCMLNKSKNVYLIVAVKPPLDAKNTIGRLFSEIASRIEARIRMDGFDSNYFEIHKDDFQSFLQELYSVDKQII